MNYDSSDFAGGVPMNEPDAVRCCAPAASAYSDGIPAGYLDNPCIPAGSHNRSHKVMEHRKLEIRKVIGREILDSRGNPTVEAQVMLKDGTVGVGKSPSGASTGAFEAVELRDMNLKRYGGKGTLKAVNHINVELNNSVLAMDSSETYSVDKAMIDEDKTHDKTRLGANSILAVSIAAWFCPSENPDSRPSENPDLCPSENPVSCPDFSPSEKPASYSAFRNFFSSNSLSYSKILILITSARFLERNSARIPSFMHSSTAHSTA